jgi:maltose phosphorylase
MAGTWLAIVEGFGGMRIHDGKILLKPLIPANWQSYSFHARFRGILFEVKITKDYMIINNLSENPISLDISGKEYQIKGSDKLVLNLKIDFFS